MTQLAISVAITERYGARERMGRTGRASARVDSACESEVVSVVLGRFETLLGRGLVDVLREDSRVDVLASDLESGALEHAVAQKAPRVAILDEPADGSHLARLRSSGPATGLLILADEPSRSYGMLLLAAGAACLARSLPPIDLLATVQLVSKGENVFGIDGCLKRHHGPLLAPREIEVLWRLIEGGSPKEVANALGLGVRTVNTYAERGLRKLNVSNTRDLADG